MSSNQQPTVHELNVPCYRVCIPFQANISPYTVSLPAQSTSEAEKTLHLIGTGSFSTGLHQTYLGQMLPRIRQSYYEALAVAEHEISVKKTTLGSRLNNPAEYRAFVEWASARRTNIARLYRLPMGIGGVVGGEIRDISKYGMGGRSFDNLIKRQAERGIAGEAAVNKVFSTIDKPNTAVTEQMLKTSKILRSGGAIFFVGGAALTGYEIYQAAPNERPEIAKKAVGTTIAGFIASDLAIGVAIMLGATGVGLIAIGVVAGIAAVYGTEQIFFAEHASTQIKSLKSNGIINSHGLMPIAHYHK